MSKPFHKRVFVVIGNGNREAAFALRLAQEGCQVAMLPGNAAYHFGKGKISYEGLPEDQRIDPYMFVLHAHETGKLACVIVGPEAFLETAVVDRWCLHGVPVIGPTRANAELELSKWFFHSVARRCRFNVPETLNAYVNDNAAKAYALKMLERHGAAVIKVDGLTGAQGVRVCTTADEVITFVDFAAKQLQERKWKGWFLVQQPIRGREVSYLALVGETSQGARVYHELSNFRDHKLTPEGKMCGGMGGFSPVPDVSARHMAYFRNRVVLPTLDYMRSVTRFPYRGFVFVGGIIDEADTLWVLEWNARMGDPEAMGVLGQLKTPLRWLLHSCVTGQHTEVEFHEGRNTGVVVLAMPEYPGPFRKWRRLSGVEELISKYPDVQLVPGGLSCYSSTAGGRIEDLAVESGRSMALVTSASSWARVEAQLLLAADEVSWSDGTDWYPFMYRTDMFSALVRAEKTQFVI